MSSAKKRGEFPFHVVQRVLHLERRVLQERSENGSGILVQHLEQNNVLLNQIVIKSVQDAENRTTQMKPICPIPSLPQSDIGGQVSVTYRIIYTSTYLYINLFSTHVNT